MRALSQLLWYQSMRGNGPLGQPRTFMSGQTLWLQIWCLNTPELFFSRRTDMNDSQQFENGKFPQTIGLDICGHSLARCLQKAGPPSSDERRLDDTEGSWPNYSGGNSKYRVGWWSSHEAQDQLRSGIISKYLRKLNPMRGLPEWIFIINCE